MTLKKNIALVASPFKFGATPSKLDLSGPVCEMHLMTQKSYSTVPNPGDTSATC